MSFTRDFTIGAPPIGSDASGSGGTSQATTAFALSANSTMVVATKWETSDGACTIADTALNTFTPLTKQRQVSNEFSVQLFYCLSTNAHATNVVTATYPAGSTYRNVVAYTYIPSGAASLVDEDGATSASSSNPVTPSFTAGDLAVCVMAEFSGTTATPDAGWTEQHDTNTNGSHGFDRIDSPGGSITGGATIGSAPATAIAAASFATVAAVPTVKLVKQGLRPRPFAPG